MSLDENFLKIAKNTLEKNPGSYVTDRGVEIKLNDGSRVILVYSKDLKDVLKVDLESETISTFESVTTPKDSVSIPVADTTTYFDPSYEGNNGDSTTTETPKDETEPEKTPETPTVDLKDESDGEIPKVVEDAPVAPKKRGRKPKAAKQE